MSLSPLLGVVIPVTGCYWVSLSPLLGVVVPVTGCRYPRYWVSLSPLLGAVGPVEWPEEVGSVQGTVVSP